MDRVPALRRLGHALAGAGACYTGHMAEKDAGELYGDAHVKSYRETGGKFGHLWRGAPTLLLTTTGAKSGEPRTMALIYGRSGDDYLLVASNGGATDHPQWFKNLRETPDVEIQVHDEVFPARARLATDEEKPAMWREMTSHWPAYDRYQEKTERPIPLVVLERT